MSFENPGNDNTATDASIVSTPTYISTLDSGLSHAEILIRKALSISTPTDTSSEYDSEHGESHRSFVPANTIQKQSISQDKVIEAFNTLACVHDISPVRKNSQLSPEMFFHMAFSCAGYEADPARLPQIVAQTIEKNIGLAFISLRGQEPSQTQDSTASTQLSKQSANPSAHAPSIATNRDTTAASPSSPDPPDRPDNNTSSQISNQSADLTRPPSDVGGRTSNKRRKLRQAEETSETSTTSPEVIRDESTVNEIPTVTQGVSSLSIAEHETISDVVMTNAPPSAVSIETLQDEIGDTSANTTPAKNSNNKNGESSRQTSAPKNRNDKSPATTAQHPHRVIISTEEFLDRMTQKFGGTLNVKMRMAPPAPRPQDKECPNFVCSAVAYHRLMQERKGLIPDTGVSDLMRGEAFGHRECVVALKMMKDEAFRHQEHRANNRDRISVETLFKDVEKNVMADNVTESDILDVLSQTSVHNPEDSAEPNKADSYLFSLFVPLAAKAATQLPANPRRKKQPPRENLYDGFEELVDVLMNDNSKRPIFLEQMGRLANYFLLHRKAKKDPDASRRHEALRLLRRLHDFRQQNLWNVILYRTNAFNKLQESTDKQLEARKIENIKAFGAKCNRLLHYENWLRLQYRSGGGVVPYAYSDMTAEARHLYNKKSAVVHRTSTPEIEYNLGWAFQRKTARARHVTTMSIKDQVRLITTYPLLPGDFLGFVTGEIDNVDRSPEVTRKTHFPGPDGLALKPSPDCRFRMLLERRVGGSVTDPNTFVTVEKVGDSNGQSFQWPVFCLKSVPAFTELVA